MCGCNCFTPENRSSTGSLSKSDPGSPEKAHPRGDVKPEPAARVKAASPCSSPGGPTTPKPPVPQGAKPALAARPTIPVKPRTASNRSIGTTGFMLSHITLSFSLNIHVSLSGVLTMFCVIFFFLQMRAPIHPVVAPSPLRSQRFLL